MYIYLLMCNSGPYEGLFVGRKRYTKSLSEAQIFRSEEEAEEAREDNEEVYAVKFSPETNMSV